ncbi:HesA/MoeB/ThiF family protein [Candidatus Litorirhabdus singularis]
MLGELDIAGQERLLAANVLILGLGGLGCPAALYLAAAGVGTLRLVDDDVVESSNLQRQIAHGEADVGALKVDSAARSIAAINSDTQVERFAIRADGETLAGLLEGIDLVVDASDSFASRFAVNQACVAANIPLVSGAAIRSEGQVGVFDPASGTACYQCLYPDAPEDADLSCAESGVLAPMVGVIGSLQALEAVKVLAQFGEPLRGKLLMVDGWSLQVRRINLQPAVNCPVCGSR